MLGIDRVGHREKKSPKFTQHTSAYVGGGAALLLLPLHTEYVSIRQHISAYIGGGAGRLLLPLPAAYVSIRQHTCVPTLVHAFH